MPWPTASLKHPDLERYHWIRELHRCERRFDYLCASYLHIKSKDVIGFPTLRFNPVQRVLWERMRAQLRREGWVRQVWGKARAVGASTLAEAWTFYNTAYQDNRSAIMLVHDEPTSFERFDVIHTFLDALPDPLKPLCSYRSKTRMMFKNRNSKIKTGHARNPNVGASETIHISHETEWARYPNPEEVQASLAPTYSEAKGAQFSSVIRESTSVYGGTWFKEFAEASRKGETEYEFHFVPWFLHQSYTAPVPEDFELTVDEQELKRRYQLTDGQLAWRRKKQTEYVTNPQLIDQEYPYSWEDSWRLPKGTRRLLDEALLTALKQGVRPATRMMPTSTGLEAMLGGPVDVWAEPEEGVFYDFGLDPAEGASDASDWTVGCVIRRDTLEQVAQFRLHLNPAAPEFFDLVYWLGMAYHGAQFCPDITAGWGHAVMREMMHRNYPTIWRWRHFDDAKGRASQKLGFLFTPQSKRTLVTTTVAALTAGHVTIHSEILWNELVEFLCLGLDQWGAAPGHHDDCVVAWMLAILAARGEQSTLIPADPPVVATTIGKPWAVHDVDADLPAAALAWLDTSPWRIR
jgi:hypothetical protein